MKGRERWKEQGRDETKIVATSVALDINNVPPLCVGPIKSRRKPKIPTTSQLSPTHPALGQWQRIKLYIKTLFTLPTMLTSTLIASKGIKWEPIYNWTKVELFVKGHLAHCLNWATIATHFRDIVCWLCYFDRVFVRYKWREKRFPKQGSYNYPIRPFTETCMILLQTRFGDCSRYLSDFFRSQPSVVKCTCSLLSASLSISN